MFFATHFTFTTTASHSSCPLTVSHSLLLFLHCQRNGLGCLKSSKQQKKSNSYVFFMQGNSLAWTIFVAAALLVNLKRSENKIANTNYCVCLNPVLFFSCLISDFSFLLAGINKNKIKRQHSTRNGTSHLHMCACLLNCCLFRCVSHPLKFLLSQD